MPANNDEVISRMHALEERRLLCDEDDNYTYETTLLKIQKLNDDASIKLESLGFNPTLLKKIIRREELAEGSDNRRQSIVTEPYTKARQDLLMNSKNTASSFYYITRGGDALTCTNMIIAKERKLMEPKLKKIETVKKLWMAR